MTHIDNEEIIKIRNAANIADIIGSYIPVTLKGKDYKCVCPFHDDHSPSMSISVSKQIYKCFSCNAAGNVFTFVENYENVSFIEAVKIVADKIGYNIKGELSFTPVNKYQKEYDLMNLTAKYFQNNLATKDGLLAKEYLLERGINDEVIKEFKIGLSKDDPTSLVNFLLKKNYDIKMLEELGLVNISQNNYYDVFTRRITFPLCDPKGNIVGFSSRIYRGEEAAKYINTKETYLYKKGNNLFNYHLAKDEAKKTGSLIIVEGQMDAIRVYISGLKNVVALMGTALTKEQVDLIKKLRCKVILCLDSDNAGEKATLVNGDILLKNNIAVGVVRLASAKDPDEYILKEGIESFQKNILAPLEYFDFKMKSMKKSVNENNAEELSNYLNAVLENLSEIDDPILKEVTLNKLSEEYKINLDILKQKLQALAPIGEVAKEVFKPKIEAKKPQKSNNYEKLIAKILFYMMNDEKYVKIYQQQLGFFENKMDRLIANEIVYYVEFNGKINLADFITYSKEKENLADLVLQITNLADEEIHEDAFNEYLKKIKRKTNEMQIKKLKEQLKKQLDKAEKIKIAKQITELKKGSV